MEDFRRRTNGSPSPPRKTPTKTIGGGEGGKSHGEFLLDLENLRANIE
jgi:hypothetical protein